MFFKFNPLKLWEEERHHDALIKYYDFKISLYSSILKLKDERLSPQDRRSLVKVTDELQQNISEFQTENKYYLEYFLNKHKKHE